MSVRVLFKCIEARVVPAIRFETCALEGRKRSRRCSFSTKQKQHSEIRENLRINRKDASRNIHECLRDALRGR